MVVNQSILKFDTWSLSPFLSLCICFAFYDCIGLVAFYVVILWSLWVMWDCDNLKDFRHWVPEPQDACDLTHESLAKGERGGSVVAKMPHTIQYCISKKLQVFRFPITPINSYSHVIRDS